MLDGLFGLGGVQWWKKSPGPPALLAPLVVCWSEELCDC